MSSQTAKALSAQAAKPHVKAVPSTASAGAPESKPNSASKANSLLGRSLGPVTAEMRRTMIAEAAYYIAEQRGFDPGREVEDWLLAEKRIDAALSP